MLFHSHALQCLGEIPSVCQHHIDTLFLSHQALLDSHEKDNAMKASVCSTTSCQSKNYQDEEEYRKRLLDTSRNKTFMKIVYDKRNGDSKVYVQTDDLIIEVDEVKMRHQTYGLHDKAVNKNCQMIYYLLQQWPDAIESVSTWC